jgi:hypothetical protein
VTLVDAAAAVIAITFLGAAVAAATALLPGQLAALDESTLAMDLLRRDSPRIDAKDEHGQDELAQHAQDIAAMGQIREPDGEDIEQLLSIHEGASFLA